MKPILFNIEMVRAILGGRKTVTRRVAKPYFGDYDTGIKLKKIFDDVARFESDNHSALCDRKLPYKIGDILYVRETWQCFNPYTDKEYVYKATNDYSDVDNMKWLPSIHMPKEAARIFLRVTDVRVERLQDMPHDAPMQEGIKAYTKDGQLYKYAVSDDWWIEFHRKHEKEFNGTYWQDMPKNPTIAFSYLWNSTIPKKDQDQYGWNANPWVWVIEFERCEKPEEE